MREGNKSKEGGEVLVFVTGGREMPGREQEGTFQDDDEVLYSEGLQFRGHTVARVSQPVCDSDLHLLFQLKKCLTYLWVLWVMLGI